MKKLIYFFYFLFLVSLILFSYLFIDPNLIYIENLYTGFAFQNRTLVSIIYLVFIILFFILYILFIKKKYFKKINLKILIGLSSILIISYPAMISFDIFNYFATSKVLFYYHENPYLIMPVDFINEHILVFTRAANKLALYGIFWTFISGIPYSLSFGNYIASIFMLKVFISLFYFGLIFLIWKLTKNKLSVMLFAANPLVIIETFISGHNDIVMMFFALLAVYLLKNKRIFFAVFCLFLSILIKYATLFLVPIFLFAIIQYIKNKKINWNKFYLFSFFSLFVIFILSFLREEIYPWYAIWPLTFLVLVPQKNKLINVYLGLSFGLMLSYLAYMYFGTYFGPTPAIKIVLIFIPPIVLFIYQTIRMKKFSKDL